MRIQASTPEVNKSTVYRTPKLLEELGPAVKSELRGEFICHHAERRRHRHLVCRKCGKIMGLDEDALLPLEKVLLEEFEFEAEPRHLAI
jgi:Fur family ferric uptake transcriptional regulator